MNRRAAVAGLIAVSGSVITLPIWMTGCNGTPKVHIAPATPEVQALLGAIAATVIPPSADGKDPGTLAAGVDKYLIRIIDDTLEPAERTKVYARLQAVEDESEAAFGVSFVNADKMEREAVLLKFAGSPDKGDREFFELLKRETIKAFQTSQHVMVDYLHYKIACSARAVGYAVQERKKGNI
ncbi:MAG TPA: gluconate 2-dehydrogenase subunit 3 family protein [Puia sp.]|nr:gluconate 2-dehydrogenase subunit 3 family protein [Puia sp.]